MATEAPAVARGTVVICRGGDCRRCPGYDKLRNALCAAGAIVETVGCVGICSGPAVAVTIGDRLEFVRKVRGQVRDDIVALAVADREPSSRLRNRMLGSSARNKATKKLAKRLAKVRG